MLKAETTAPKNTPKLPVLHLGNREAPRKAPGPAILDGLIVVPLAKAFITLCQRIVFCLHYANFVLLYNA